YARARRQPVPGDHAFGQRQPGWTAAEEDVQDAAAEIETTHPGCTGAVRRHDRPFEAHPAAEVGDTRAGRVCYSGLAQADEAVLADPGVARGHAALHLESAPHSSSEEARGGRCRGGDHVVVDAAFADDERAVVVDPA